MIRHVGLGWLNHLLSRESWASDQLRAHAGRTVRVRSGAGPEWTLRINASGLLEQASDEAAGYSVVPDVAVQCPPTTWAKLVLDRTSAMGEFEYQGDPSLIQLIRCLVRELRWDAEDDLARLIGDIPAHRVAQLGSRLAAVPRVGVERFARNLAEFLAEEAGVLARDSDSTRLASEVTDCAQRTEQLAGRIESIRRTLAG